MSSIKLTADSGGGTFEIKAPSSSGNTRVLTLPDTHNLTLNGGKILQVVAANKTDTFSASASNGTYHDITGLSVSITPSATSSKILVSYKCTMSTANGGYSGRVRLVRYRADLGTTAIYIGDASGSRSRCSSAMQADNDTIGHIKTRDLVGDFLDSPNTTVQLTYKLQYASDYSNAFVYIGKSQEDSNAIYRPRTPSSITVMEVLA